MSERMKTNTIGIIVQNIKDQSADETLDLLANRLKENGYFSIFASTSGSVERECQLLEHFSKITDCIFIISSAANYYEIENSTPSDIPVIFLYNKPEGCPHTCIVESDYSAIYQGILSYSGRGNGSVACVCANRNLSSTQDFIRAYTDAIKTSPAGFREDLIIDTAIHDLNPREILDNLLLRDCHAIFSTTPAITSALIDSLLFYNLNPEHEPFVLLGYGTIDSILSSQMHIDLILHPSKEIIELAIQQGLYQMKHPGGLNKRVFLLKGTLQMHKSNGLNM